MKVQQAHQHRNRALAGGHDVDVGRSAVGGDEVQVPEKGGRHVAVEVLRAADAHGAGKRCAHGGEQVGLRVVQALHAHGAVDVEEEALQQGAQGSQRVEDLALHAVVVGEGHSTPGHGGEVADAVSCNARHLAEIRVPCGEQHRACAFQEVRVEGSEGAKGAALDGDAKDAYLIILLHIFFLYYFLLIINMNISRDERFEIIKIKIEIR